jgi:ParB-like chromosome segregation protein Spo0J
VLQNLVVNPATPEQLAAEPAYTHYVNAGERRHRAIGLLVKLGRRPPDWPVPCSVKTLDQLAQREVALLENLSQRALPAMDEARAFAELRDDFQLSTEQIADRAGCTLRNVQYRLQLLQLSPEDQAAVAAKTLKLEDARAKLATPREPKAAAPPALEGEVGLFDEDEEAAAPSAPPAGELSAQPTEGAYGLGRIRKLLDADPPPAREIRAAPEPPAPVIVQKPVLAIGPASLRYEGAIDVLRVIAEHPGQSVGAMWSACGLHGMTQSAIRRRIRGFEGDGLVTAYPGRLTDAGKAQLAAIDAAMAAPKSPWPAPSVTREAAIAAAEGRLAKARDALREGEPLITDIRRVAHAECWAPAPAADFLELVLEALRA